MSILDIDFTNYHKVQASRMTVTSRSALRAEIEHEMQAYLQAGGQITTLPCETKTAPRLTGEEKLQVALLPKTKRKKPSTADAYCDSAKTVHWWCTRTSGRTQRLCDTLGINHRELTRRLKAGETAGMLEAIEFLKART